MCFTGTSALLLGVVVHIWCTDRRVHPVGEVVEPVREQVAAEVERRRRRGVAHRADDGAPDGARRQPGRRPNRTACRAPRTSRRPRREPLRRLGEVDDGGVPPRPVTARGRRECRPRADLASSRPRRWSPCRAPVTWPERSRASAPGGPEPVGHHPVATDPEGSRSPASPRLGVARRRRLPRRRGPAGPIGTRGR